MWYFLIFYKFHQINRLTGMRSTFLPNPMSHAYKGTEAQYILLVLLLGFLFSHPPLPFWLLLTPPLPPSARTMVTIIRHGCTTERVWWHHKGSSSSYRSRSVMEKEYGDCGGVVFEPVDLSQIPSPSSPSPDLTASTPSPRSPFTTLLSCPNVANTFHFFIVRSSRQNGVLIWGFRSKTSEAVTEI